MNERNALPTGQELDREIGARVRLLTDEEKVRFLRLILGLATSEKCGCALRVCAKNQTSGKFESA